MPMRSQDPNSPGVIVMLTKKSVAQSQLETAIRIWFDYGDPISIYTLASAASNCYHCLAEHEGFYSVFQIWLRKQSRPFQKLVDKARNFAKHGHIDLKGRVPYAPTIADELIMDSIVCHEVVFAPAQITPIMRLYTVRYFVEYPDYEIPPGLEGLVDRPLAERLLKIDRPQSFKDFFDSDNV